MDSATSHHHGGGRKPLARDSLRPDWSTSRWVVSSVVGRGCGRDLEASNRRPARGSPAPRVERRLHAGRTDHDDPTAPNARGPGRAMPTAAASRDDGRRSVRAPRGHQFKRRCRERRRSRHRLAGVHGRTTGPSRGATARLRHRAPGRSSWETAERGWDQLLSERQSEVAAADLTNAPRPAPLSLKEPPSIAGATSHPASGDASRRTERSARGAAALSAITPANRLPATMPHTRHITTRRLRSSSTSSGGSAAMDSKTASAARK